MTDSAAPFDVPEAAVEAAAVVALNEAFPHSTKMLLAGLKIYAPDLAATVLSAALPSIEAALRERIAGEIEAHRGPEPSNWMAVDDQDVGIWNGLEDAIRIVRGGGAS